MNIPLDILRFILSFNNEYRIICNRFLNIKKLTKNNPTMKAKFDNLDIPSID